MIRLQVNEGQPVSNADAALLLAYIDSGVDKIRQLENHRELLRAQVDQLQIDLQQANTPLAQQQQIETVG